MSAATGIRIRALEERVTKLEEQLETITEQLAETMKLVTPLEKPRTVSKRPKVDVVPVNNHA